MTTINRQKLITALEAVRPGIASKEIIEQSTSFIFMSGRVYTYNDSIAVSHACPEELAGAVQSKELYMLLTRLVDDEIDIKTTDSEMLIKGKRTKASISLQANITLPIDTINNKKTWVLLPEEFSTAIKFVLVSAGNDMTKPWSTAVHVTTNDTNNIIETCDNFRLTQFLLPKTEHKNTIFNTNSLIPAAACVELYKYTPTHYSITANNQWIHFINAVGTEFSCRLVADKFPDLSPFLLHKYTCKFEFNENTIEILDRACVFLTDKTMHPVVTIKADNGSMIITSKSNKGWFEEMTRIAGSKAAFEFIIDPQVLKDMLPSLKNCELNDDKSILKFEGDNFIYCCATVSP